MKILAGYTNFIDGVTVPGWACICTLQLKERINKTKAGRPITPQTIYSTDLVVSQQS